MTIDEAIEHSGEKAKEQRYYASFERNGMMYQSCIKCAEEHEQLAEWLEQLKEYKQLEEHGRLVKLPYNSNLRDSKPCCRCDSRQTNADRIRNMSDEELAEFLAYNAYCEECYVEKDDSCCYPDGTCKQKHLDWLQSKAE